MILQAEFEELQRMLAQTDLLFEPRSRVRNNDFLEILLIKRKCLKLKIYQEVGHAMPHLHIDYGKEHHTASYTIESGEKIEGNLPKRYDYDVNRWIIQHRERLLEVWASLQMGRDPKLLVAELQADA